MISFGQYAEDLTPMVRVLTNVSPLRVRQPSAFCLYWGHFGRRWRASGWI